MSDTLRLALGGIRLDQAMVLFDRLDEGSYRCGVDVGGLTLSVELTALPPNPAHTPGQANPWDQEMIALRWLVVGHDDLDPGVLTEAGSPTLAMAQALNNANTSPGGSWSFSGQPCPSLTYQAVLPATLATGANLSLLLELSRQAVHTGADLLGRLCRVGPWVYRDWSWEAREPVGHSIPAHQARARLEAGRSLTLLVGSPDRPTTVMQIGQGGQFISTSFLDQRLRPWLRYEYVRVGQPPAVEEVEVADGSGEPDDDSTTAPFEQTTPAFAATSPFADNDDEQAHSAGPYGMLLRASTMHAYHDPVTPSALAASRGAAPARKAAQGIQPSVTIGYSLDLDGFTTTTRTTFNRQGKITDRQFTPGHLDPATVEASLLPVPDFGAWSPFLRRQR